jgi:hypothetical protein
MKKHKTIWRLWAKSLGEKASKCDNESDTVALVRSFIFITYLITNCFIVAGVIKHWNDNQPIEIYIDRTPHAIPSDLPQTEKERLFKTNSNLSVY